MKLSVIICCYNERETIADVIARTQAVDLGGDWEREIIVVDNFSTDGTREILQQINDPEIRTIFHERNMGKGMSIRTGIDHMTGNYMIIQDADKEYDPAEHPKFCRKVEETGATAVYGSRILGGEVRYEYAHAYLGVRMWTFLTNLLFGSKLTDVGTGTKMVRGDVAQSLHLTLTGFNLEFELTNKVLLAGHEIVEVPIHYDPRTYAEGKKITIQDGLKIIFTMLRDRLNLTPLYKPSFSSSSSKT
ncbi:MAG: glycosyltransferase family 2 protein [Ardenticatenaceae bacterium]|nr:glycosyltransferase family 2 protein [Anaerolineales bacterium]MCB8920453.1 glycosyltransferase family 2 protein [Ardenticatenaceae bacterium]MCB8989408.1 glycosyltransferase family 2 protein [Ardenticatenaceae bacterium]MCB9004563.1 glycosyltransferase family 2 protein [Ardenticatenaceae bacterium]